MLSNSVERKLIKYFLEKEFGKEISSLLYPSNGQFYRGKFLDSLPKESYPFIPIPPLEFIKVLSETLKNRFFIFDRNIPFSYERKDLSLVDLGCGVGFTLSLATFLGFSATGIEINPYSIEIAKKKGFNVIEGNIFDHVEKVKNFNVIYTYMPIQDRDLMSKLGEKIRENMSNFSLWIEMYPAYPEGSRITYKLNEEIKKYHTIDELVSGIMGEKKGV